MTASLRDTNLEKLASTQFDVLIIGGGINGAVSAASLAGRGVRVALIDREDFASGVSSNSSNLAWGGIKYMESLEFLLVDKLCRSRNRLMRAYPSTVKEVRFLTTIARGFRFPPFFVFLGSVLYWIMGRFATRPPRYLGASSIESVEPIINTSNAAGGLEYSDCYLYDNDARFVWNFIRRSLNYGAIAANYVQSDELTHDGEGWLCQARDQITGSKFQIRARAVLNAAGPHVDALNRDAGRTTAHHHLFSKGVHLIVDQ
jgi:glycerol-3-phosphate dehydrogenase